MNPHIHPYFNSVESAKSVVAIPKHDFEHATIYALERFCLVRLFALDGNCEHISYVGIVAE